jgi:hypothetical protein
MAFTRASMLNPRLSIELVPQTAHYQNIRSALPAPIWDNLRKACYNDAEYRCEICQGRGPDHPVEAHEKWEYIHRGVPEKGWQMLVKIQALCPDCHEVKHLGLAEKRGRLDQALAHLAYVNGWSHDEALLYARSAFETWQKRSRELWGLDISVLKIQGWPLPQYLWPPA